VRWRVVSEGWWREGPPLHTTYLVVPLDDGDVDELASGDSGIGWELVVCGIDVILGEQDRRVRLEVVRPHPHGLEGVRGRTRYPGTRTRGVDLAGEWD
jgi:hypothetical protein